MGNIHDIFKEDEPIVSASNIVGTYLKEGRCYYDGRPQGGKESAEAEEDLIKKLTAKQREIIKDQGVMANQIYPDNNLWEIRIFNL